MTERDEQKIMQLLLSDDSANWEIAIAVAGEELENILTSRKALYRKFANLEVVKDEQVERYLFALSVFAPDCTRKILGHLIGSNLWVSRANFNVAFDENFIRVHFGQDFRVLETR